MRRSRFTTDQIIKVLHAWDASAKPGELVRQHGITETTLYRWKKKFGGMELNDARRLKALTQNAFIESFNGTFREDCLNENWFVNLSDAQRTIEAWRIDYETERPHSRLRNLTPREFALALTSTTPSTTTPTGLT